NFLQLFNHMDNKSFLFDFFIIIGTVVFSLFVIKTLNISYPVSIVTTTKTAESTQLIVSGEGRMEVTPDTAYIDAGISAKEATVQAAQEKISQVNNNILTALAGLGVKKADIKTTNYSVQPNTAYINHDTQVTGYNGTATVTIKTKDPQLASSIIDAVVKAGANEITGTRFIVENPDIYREKARNMAIENAKSQAANMAKNLGFKLGKVENIVESGNGVQPLMMAKYDAMPVTGGG
ncbi:MAG: SIMPL domain-containing protein, partial [Chloroflexi bacterium]|nr:SIMPL domain-containing protein [Chloroflexota bacterium]